jgi:hypothetical protein
MHISLTVILFLAGMSIVKSGTKCLGQKDVHIRYDEGRECWRYLGSGEIGSPVPEEEKREEFAPI